MGVYLVCLACSVLLFLLPPSQARLPSGVCVGLCGVFCVCGGFVCCVALCVWFRRRFEMCELVVLFSRASERSECGSPTERSEGGSGGRLGGCVCRGVWAGWWLCPPSGCHTQTPGRCCSAHTCCDVLKRLSSYDLSTATVPCVRLRSGIGPIPVSGHVAPPVLTSAMSRVRRLLHLGRLPAVRFR
jgi:hypothetical protein